MFKRKQSVSLCGLILTLVFLGTAHAGVIFQDDFEDNNTDGWSFIGANYGWNASTGALQSSSSQTNYVGTPSFAVIDGITTPDNFKLEADMMVVGSVPGHGSDWGHIGFGWGISSLSQFNTSYLRTHSNHITSWKNPYQGEVIFGLPFNPVNGTQYHFSVEVNYALKEMTISLNNNSITYTGSTFDQVSSNQGGQIGLVTWGERIQYDNVVLSTVDVPEPSTFAIFALGAIGLIFRKTK